jgi:hypothetical protein
VHTRTTLAASLLAAGALTLTACSSTSSGTDAATQPASTKKPTATKSVDCSDPNLSQAQWTAHCDTSAKPRSLHLQFGQTYTWPDGVKATVTEAKVFTAYDKSIDEKPTPGAVDYQVMVKVTNGSHVPLDLGNLSVITEGATNGGEASITGWTNAAPGFEGRLAPGVTVTKADQETLQNKFGRKIVVTVQRTSADSTVMDFPEFTGSITS